MLNMVPEEGLEPSRVSPAAFEAAASAISPFGPIRNRGSWVAGDLFPVRPGAVTGIYESVLRILVDREGVEPSTPRLSFEMRFVVAIRAQQIAFI